MDGNDFGRFELKPDFVQFFFFNNFCFSIFFFVHVEISLKEMYFVMVKSCVTLYAKGSILFFFFLKSKTNEYYSIFFFFVGRVIAYNILVFILSFSIRKCRTFFVSTLIKFQILVQCVCVLHYNRFGNYILKTVQRRRFFLFTHHV